MNLKINNTRDTRGARRRILFDPIECTQALLQIEDVAEVCHDPASGSGNIVKALRRAGRKVTAADIIDRGLVKGCVEQDYLTARFITTPEAIICNQPFALAEAFLTQAICAGCPYIAMTVQLNFLELIGADGSSTPIHRLGCTFHVGAWQCINMGIPAAVRARIGIGAGT